MEQLHLIDFFPRIALFLCFGTFKISGENMSLKEIFIGRQLAIISFTLIFF